MYAYISGTVVLVSSTSIIIENQGIGYEIFAPDPYVYKKGATETVHTFHYVREDAIELFGFKDRENLDFFKKIITVKGVGPKTGLNILAKANISSIIEAIENSDIKFLRSLPGIGPKMASQMVLDLQGKLVVKESVEKTPEILDDVFDTLITLGFKRSELSGLKEPLLKLKSDDLDELLRHALKLLAK